MPEKLLDWIKRSAWQWRFEHVDPVCNTGESTSSRSSSCYFSVFVFSVLLASSLMTLARGLAHKMQLLDFFVSFCLFFAACLAQCVPEMVTVTSIDRGTYSKATILTEITHVTCTVTYTETQTVHSPPIYVAITETYAPTYSVPVYSTPRSVLQSSKIVTNSSTASSGGSPTSYGTSRPTSYGTSARGKSQRGPRIDTVAKLD